MESGSEKFTIVILDFGSQYTQLIARRIRQANVFSIILPCDITKEVLMSHKPSGVILSGGPDSVSAEDDFILPEYLLHASIPLLGICYGMQLIAQALGGKVASHTGSEFGRSEILINNQSLLLNGIEDSFDEKGQSKLITWMSHSDSVLTAPPSFTINSTNSQGAILAMSDDVRKIYGLQFHPEVSHTLQGQRIINRFVHRICHCESTWTPQSIIAQQIEQIKSTCENKHVLLALSGGVDSLVCAILVHRAIGENLHCVHVDNGLMRSEESAYVKQIFEKLTGITLTVIDAKKIFLKTIKRETNPEKKRKKIGAAFISVFEQYAKKQAPIAFLAQGTIYPDLIESAVLSKKSKVIKSHHNVGGLPKKMNLKILEPLSHLFKDEVRAIGKELGIPDEMTNRHPFPGPGLAVRILGEVTEERLAILRIADSIFLKELYQHNLYNQCSQAFCVFIPQKTVGVKGDGRVYEYIIAIRAVNTTDFMTATHTELPHSFLSLVARRIVNELPSISRVVYDITSKPPATIEWE
ncbi:MAG: glutamine-hydrolyzing GMP synthase [Methylacidiphilales bacterium]|nr:glutamine-hydrolyzing GMP synthase [Candidatus Methylacidiphilales bacterium]